MVSQVTCVKCGRVGDRLASPPLGGQLGGLVQAQICVECWKEWLAMSIRIVNHYGLQPSDPADRKQIHAFMRDFLNLREA
ncbi:MAG: Fe(2+)-trafficking protein [Chloroflexi bacterium]|nr:Fe(2+)-trafficking protein [Chloroflexota bacterium]